MDGYERAAYARKRSEGWKAADALAFATRDKGGPDVPLEQGEEWERDGYSLRLTLEQDAYLTPDDIGGGKFTSEWAEGCLDRKAEGFPPGRDEHPFYLPGMTEAEHIKDGATQTEAARYVRSYLERDEGFGDAWVYLSIGVTARREGVDLGEEYLGGIESDSGKRYLRETISELADEAIKQAADALARLVATGGDR